MQPAPYRSLLVPLDGSLFAEQALPFATEIATRVGAMVQLAEVHHPVPAMAAALEAPSIETGLDRETRDSERQYLDEVVERVRATTGLPVTSTLLDGPVAGALERLIASTETDLVVMTTHARGPMARFWLGSVADHLLQHVHIPLLLIHGGTDAAAAPVIRKILVPLDGSPFAERVLDRVVPLARAFDAGIILVSVLEPPYPVADPNGMMVVPVDPDRERHAREGTQAYLDRIAARLTEAECRVSTKVLDEQPVPAALLREAERDGADLVALASHGRGGLDRVVLGSVADKVIRSTTLPVLAVRPSVAL